MMVWRIGGDSGGTFTDICLDDDERGRIEVWTFLSIPLNDRFDELS